MILLQRYIAGYFLALGAAISTFLLSIWFFDGVIPVITFIATLTVAFFYIPYFIAEDCKKVKKYIKDIKSFKDGEISKQEFISKTLNLACEETGLPIEIVEIFFKKEKVVVS